MTERVIVFFIKLFLRIPSAVSSAPSSGSFFDEQNCVDSRERRRVNLHALFGNSDIDLIARVGALVHFESNGVPERRVLWNR